MRVESWEGLLHAHIQDAHSAKFRWGGMDCALWCGDWVRKATGRDLASQWHGKYATETELREVMEAEGYDSPQAIAEAAGYAAIQPAFARRGDIVLHPQGALGICDGVLSYFLMESGITRLQTLKCVKAWKID